MPNCLSCEATYHQLLCVPVVTRSVVDIANLVKKLLSSPGWITLQPVLIDLLDQVSNYGAFIKIEAVCCSRHLPQPFSILLFLLTHDLPCNKDGTGGPVCEVDTSDICHDGFGICWH